MTDQHPITPPLELVAQWASETYVTQHLCTQIAQWGADQQLKLDAEQIAQAYQKGADQELEECWRWMRDEGYRETAQLLHAARRPKPPSLKEQALSLISDVCSLPMMRTYSPDELLILRRAIEALPDA
jgi:hypothetical protein